MKHGPTPPRSECIMKSCWLLTAAFLGLLIVAPVSAQSDALLQSIDSRSASSWQMARKIWEWAEAGYQEKQSSALLADTLEKAGFKVERGVGQDPDRVHRHHRLGQAGHRHPGRVRRLAGPVAGRGAGPASCGPDVRLRPCVRPSPLRRGHRAAPASPWPSRSRPASSRARCASTAARRRRAAPPRSSWSAPACSPTATSCCTGTRPAATRPATRLACRGSPSSSASTAWAVHAAGGAGAGRSALDAVELTNHAAQLLREHTPDFTRIHHVITDGGGAPNVVPDFAEVFYYIRHPKAEVVAQLYPRLLKCAQAAALATETKLETVYLGGTMELLPNDALAAASASNLVKLNDLKYTDEERQFAVRIQETLTNPPPLESIAEVGDSSGILGKGSTDVGDVSWVVPTVGFSTASWVPGTPGHSWQAVAAGGTSIGQQGDAAGGQGAGRHRLGPVPRSEADRRGQGGAQEAAGRASPTRRCCSRASNRRSISVTRRARGWSANRLPGCHSFLRRLRLARPSWAMSHSPRRLR